MADPIKITAGTAMTAYHVDTGAVVFPYAIDAHSAVSRFPDEWSLVPWSASEQSAARQRRIDAHQKAVEDAKALGVPPPPAPVLPPVIEPTPAEKTEIDADTKARVEAAALLKAADEKEAKEKAEVDKVAAARALLASPPPQPDPLARRPFGRKGEMTPAERAAADKKAGKPTPPAPAPVTPPPQPGPVLPPAAPAVPVT